MSTCFLPSINHYYLRRLPVIISKVKNELGPKSAIEHMQSVELVDVLQDSCNTIESLLCIKHSFNSKLNKLVGKYYKFVEVP